MKKAELPGSEITTASTVAAGGAVGSIIAWGLSLIHGVDVPVEVGGLFATVGAWTFGRLFGG